jgi:hypothetical protein
MRYLYLLLSACILFGSCNESKQQRQTRLLKEAEELAELEMYDKYIDNSLQTGDTPYSDFYGENLSCEDYGCSQITIRTPSNSDVLVTIKQNGEVVRHAYIQANDSYSFSFPNGTYQAFFYYGRGWNPEKEMKRMPQGTLKGGFLEDESFGKNDPQILENQELTYELILQQNGNFSTRPSNAEDVF